MKSVNENYYRLKEMCTKIGSGSTPKGGKSVYIEAGVSLIRSQNVYNMRFSYNGLAHISDELAKKLKNVIIKKDDLLLNITGDSVARCCLVPDDIIPARVNQHVSIIRTKQDMLNSRFLMYYLVSPFMQKYLIMLAQGKGASRSAITKDMIEKLTIPVVDINIQTIIVNYLEVYDKLIKNNNERIKILEQMVEELFKEWFVRFRYDIKIESFKNSSLGKIPESFDIIKMKDAIDYYIGGGWGNDSFSEEFPVKGFVIRGADFPKVEKGDISSTPLRFHKQSNYNARKLEANDIVFEISGGTQKQPVGRSILITEELLDQFDNSAICASFCKLIRVNEQIISPIYLYYWLQYMYETRMIDQFQLQSTGIINFKFEYFLRKGLILLPPKELMELFEKQVVLMKKQIDELAIANSNLIKQRDLLLPRLMSGKLEVK